MMTMCPIIKLNSSSYLYSFTLVNKGFHIHVFFKLVSYNVKEIVKYTVPVSVFA